MTSPQRQPASRLEELLRARQFVITAEITPPVSCNADDLLRRAAPLAGLADAVNVTDGASARAHLSAPIAAGELEDRLDARAREQSRRDRNRIALQADLMGAAACGVRNLLCLTGDDPTAGDQPQTMAVSVVESTSNTALACGWSPALGSSPVRHNRLRTPQAAAPMRSACNAIRLRSREVNWRIGPPRSARTGARGRWRRP